MIHFTEIPKPCSLSKNPIHFGLKATNWTAETDIYPFINIELLIEMEVGKSFYFKFINPATEEVEEITFLAFATPIKDGYQIPGTLTGAIATPAYAQSVYEFIIENKTLTTFYDVSISGTNIKFTAKEGVEELVPFNFDTNHRSPIGPLFIPLWMPTINTSYWKAKRRRGHRIKFQVYFESDYKSNTYHLISEQSSTVDNDGNANIDIASIIDSEIRNSFETPPLPNFILPTETNKTQKAKVLRRFYVEASEIWSDINVEEKSTKSDLFFAHFGGVSMDDFTKQNIFEYLNAEKTALTWWKDKKRIYPEQPDWMSAMNASNSDVQNWNAEVEILYKDLTTDILQLGQFDLSKWETVTLPVGYQQLNIQVIQDPLKEVYGWKMRILNEAMEIVTERTYLLHFPENFTTKTLVYINSFGVAESFVTSGFWKNNILTSNEIAVKTLSHDYKSINGRDFVFSKSSKHTFNVRTGILSKSEAKALQSLMNVAPVFLIDNKEYSPVIIETGTFTFNEESEIYQTLDFKLNKSMELTNVSEMLHKPTLIIENNKGIFKAIVKFDGAIQAFSNMIVTENGNAFTTASNTGNTYTFPVRATINGVYVFTCSVTIGLTTFNLSENATFSREVISFKTPNHSSSPTTFCEVKTSVIQPIFFDAQDSNIVTYGATPGSTILIGGPVPKGIKTQKVEASDLSNIHYFKVIGQKYTDFNLDRFVGLKSLLIISCDLPGHFSTANFKELENISFYGNKLTSIEIGLQKNLISLNLSNQLLTQAACIDLVNELHKYRKVFQKPNGNIVVNISGNMTAPLSTFNTVLDKVNGTGKYLGDGLIQNDILLTY